MEPSAPASAAELPAQGRDLLLGALTSGGDDINAPPSSSNGHTTSNNNMDDLLVDSSTASTPAAMTHEVHWEGYVRKKGDWLPRWEERYLILDGATLTYYNSKEEARSARNLRGRMIISKVRPENYGKAHGFLIETQGHKHFHLCCTTELEKDMWVEMMQAAIEEGVRHAHSRLSMEGMEALQMQTSPTQVDLRGFYFAFRQLLISHSSSPQFFPKLSRDVVLTSNYAPTVPFWGEYHGLDGVLHFFSILYETVEITAFFVTDIAQAKEGCTAVVAGRETMKNRDNGRKFTQQWQHTIEFAPDGRVKSLTISADPIAASAVFGCSATSSLSLPMAAVVGNAVHDNPAGKLHVVVFRGEQISDQGFIDDEEQTDGSEADDDKRPSNRRVFLGLRLVTDGKTNVYAPTSSANCVARTRTCDPDEARNPKWNSKHEIPFAGSSRGKPCFILIEAWEVVDSDGTGKASERVIGVAKVNLAPFLALASTSRTVRESVIHSDIARGAVPQWYTLLSANETKFTCGRVQLSISFEASMASFAAMSRATASRTGIDENSPSLDLNAPTPQVRPSGAVVQSMSHRVALARGCSFRDTKRDNHQFRVGNTNFDVPKRYQMIKAVGQGAYGCVIAASDTETGQALAIKNIPNAFNDLIDAKRILREIRLMRHLNHPNLKLQELIFEDVCAFHPDARIPDPVVPTSAAVNSAPSRAHGLSRTDSTSASSSARTSVSASAPVSAPAIVSASVAVPPAPVSLVAPASLSTSTEQPRTSPVVLLPSNAPTAHESRASETPLDAVVSPSNLERASIPTTVSASLPTSLPPMPTVSVEQVPASTSEHERSAQAEVAIEIMQTPAHTVKAAEEATVEVSLDDIGSSPIHNVSVTEAAVNESGAPTKTRPTAQAPVAVMARTRMS
ncbi:Inward rectifier potassium channel 4 [Phytophthora nicotianae]|uniref:Inward rectifier potassium channel 4 n=1 Tax=Phytophthora nicotianae TaxID=4792 RepID=A0A0W8DTC6_PHYNI|nr:Inward rectifier potassium channel 4 [Phytophthora nicotianae]